MASEQIHLICHEGKTIDRVDDSWDQLDWSRLSH
jgi:hypothetical protein